jgi:succinate-semialdehyde dehydrogenase/glutarate-semialdehyde dehydrogenase
MGKIISQAESEIDLSANILDYYADNAESFLADKN